MKKNQHLVLEVQKIWHRVNGQSSHTSSLKVVKYCACNLTFVERRYESTITAVVTNEPARNFAYPRMQMIIFSVVTSTVYILTRYHLFLRPFLMVITGCLRNNPPRPLCTLRRTWRSPGNSTRQTRNEWVHNWRTILMQKHQRSTQYGQFLWPVNRRQ